MVVHAMSMQCCKKSNYKWISLFFFAVVLALKPTKILETEFQIKIKCLIEYQHLCYPIDSQGRIKTINLYIPINQSLMSLIFW